MYPLPPAPLKNPLVGEIEYPQVLPTLNPFPKLVTHISLGLYGLKKTRSGWRNGYVVTAVNVGVTLLILLEYHSPSVSVVRYISLALSGLKVQEVTRSRALIRVQVTPRLVLLYNPPSPFGGPPQPLNTPKVFCVRSYDQ
jgi:hypothetical protein